MRTAVHEKVNTASRLDNGNGGVVTVAYVWSNVRIRLAPRPTLDFTTGSKMGVSVFLFGHEVTTSKPGTCRQQRHGSKPGPSGQI